MNLAAAVPLFLAFLCGCAPRNAPTPVVSPAPPVSPIAITPAKFLGNEITSASLTTNPIVWEVTIVRIPEGKINQLGLQSLFALPSETNSLTAEEIDSSTLTQLARRATNVILITTSSGYAALCSLETASSLIATFTRHADVETNAPASLFAHSAGLEARYYSGNVLSVVTGMKVQASGATPMITQLSFGDTLTLRNRISESNAVLLSAVARIEGFSGYADGKSENGVQPHPAFNLHVYGTRTLLHTNEVLLLGSPTIATIQRSTDRVPRLSDIPFFGQLFVKTRVQTNFFRSLVIIRRKRE